jgi:hypothetical protein
MGGSGSGLRNGGPVTANHVSIDVRSFQRSGLLIPGTTIGNIPMEETGQLPPVQLQVGVDEISLTLRKSNELGSVREYTTRIRLERTSCNYDGSRVWFICPRCSQRVAILYQGYSRLFACRRCRKLAYRSQREAENDRALRKVNNLRAKLGWATGYIHGYGVRPKGMHRKSYELLLRQYDHYLGIVLMQASAQIDAIGAQLSLLGTVW